MYELSKLPLEKIVVRCRVSSFRRLGAPAHLASLLLQVSNTICQTEHIKQANGKLEIMDISPVLAESIRRVSALLG